MRRNAAPCSFAALALLAAAEPPHPEANCPTQPSSEVAVKALRFSDGRPYSFMVTNNGTRPIMNISVGWQRHGDTFIEDSYNTRPASMGAPAGWRGIYVLTQDPRLPGSHSETLSRYFWERETAETEGIQPGRSLSGFSVQLPTPHEAELAYVHFRESHGLRTKLPTDPPLEERLPPQPDLTQVPFTIGVYARCPLVGTVELDSSWGADDRSAIEPRSTP